VEWIALAWDVALHLDRYLAAFIESYGAWVYALLFLIVYCETGLVVTPFLPGDSLLFVVGTLAAVGGLDIGVTMALLVTAALAGDNTNYWLGRWAGPRVFSDQASRWLNPRHLARAHAFYARHGGKTVVIARFVPVVRTYAPFVAGVGAMRYRRFLAFSVAGALLWVVSLCLAGYWFGNLPVVRQNLSLVIAAIVLASISPGIFGWLRARRGERDR